MGEPAAPADAAPAAWSLRTRFAFRFFFVYWFLYSLPFPFNQLPEKEELTTLPWTAKPAESLAAAIGPIAKSNDEWILAPYRKGEHAAVIWVGEHVLKLEKRIDYFPSGSGDKTSDYVLNLIVFAAAASAALIWSVADSRRQSYPLLHDLLRVYVRFVLGATMLSYGAVKILPLQFSTPSLDRLMQPYGDSSPMGLLWTFMGASTAYTCFAGAGEVLSGLLLFFRRTTTLGALISFAVMANVVAMNFCYDVPVKIYSTNLLLMALFLMVPDLGRLANVLIFNRPAPPRDLGPPWKKLLWLRWPLLAIKLGFVAWLLVVYVGMAFINSGERDKAPKAELVGVFVVEEFKRNGAVLPPLVTDATQWRQIVFNESAFQGEGFCSIRRMDDSLVRCRVKVDMEKKTVTLLPHGPPDQKWELTFARPSADVLALEGEADGQKLAVRLKLVGAPQFLLTTRGFHWVQEHPYIR